MKPFIRSFAILLISSLSFTVAAQNNTPPDAAKGVSNASRAKPPKGTMSFTVDGVTLQASESQVQCMFVGMGPNMAQGVITGRKSPGFLLSFSFISKPAIGEVPKAKGSVPTIGATLIKDGLTYNSMPGGNAEFTVTKLTKDGNNAYIGGTFNATLKSSDGKTITISNGVCTSGYL